MKITENDIEKIFSFTIKSIQNIYDQKKINDNKIKQFFENKKNISPKLFKKCKEKLNKIESQNLGNKEDDQKILIIQNLFNNNTEIWFQKLVEAYPNVLTQSIERIETRIKYYIYCCKNNKCKIPYKPEDPHRTGQSLRSFLSRKEEEFLKKMNSTKKEFQKWKSEN